MYLAKEPGKMQADPRGVYARAPLRVKRALSLPWHMEAN